MVGEMYNLTSFMVELLVETAEVKFKCVLCKKVAVEFAVVEFAPAELAKVLCK